MKMMCRVMHGTATPILFLQKSKCLPNMFFPGVLGYLISSVKVKCLSGKLHKLPSIRFFFTNPSFLMAKFIMKLSFRASAPCHLLWRRAIRRTRNTSSWSFHGGTIWLFLTCVMPNLVFPFCIYAAIIFHSFFIYSPWFNRDPRESWIGQSQTSFSFSPG